MLKTRSMRLALCLALASSASWAMPTYANAAPAKPAKAKPTDAEVRAREAFQAGRALFEAGRYRDSIAQFEAGYALAPRPIFLLNIGQAYRQLFEPERAREKYVAFLATAAADDANRPEVEEMVREIDRAVAARAPAPTPVVTAPVVTPAVTLTEPPPPPPHKSFVRKNWWIFPVGAAVLAGVGVGIYFGVRPKSPACGTLGCLDGH